MCFQPKHIFSLYVSAQSEHKWTELGQMERR